MNEIEEIRSRYERRKKLPSDLYSFFNRGNLFIIHQRERKLLGLLENYGMNSLNDKKLLDVGCGSGGWLREFIKYGATPENLYGIDLLEERVALGERVSPNIHITQGNAEHLDFPDNTFDIVFQSVVFTSIHENEMKKKIADEMLRVMKNDGIILWYDFRYNNPLNPDVKGIKKEEIKNLFPNCQYNFNTVTLTPPIVRKLVGISWLACYLLEKIPLLRTHYMIVIKKHF